MTSLNWEANFSGAVKKRIMAEKDIASVTRDSDYIEVQTYGKVTLDDIEAIYVPPRRIARTEELVKRAGYEGKISVRPTGTSNPNRTLGLE